MEPREFIDQLYLALLDKGWTLNDIDSMDIIYYLKLLNKKLGTEKVYIDSILWSAFEQVFFFMKVVS